MKINCSTGAAFTLYSTSHLLPIVSTVLEIAMLETSMIVGTCQIELYLPGVSSLKEKRSIVKSLLARLRNTFNVSAAEIDHHDLWQSALIGVAAVSNSVGHADQVLQGVLMWIETNFPDALITRHEITLL